jgi:hypothetical protein
MNKKFIVELNKGNLRIAAWSLATDIDAAHLRTHLQNLEHEIPDISIFLREIITLPPIQLNGMTRLQIKSTIYFLKDGNWMTIPINELLPDELKSKVVEGL